jgi:tRNA threonylcarbamoyladenosine biosynthesis protein TsaE
MADRTLITGSPEETIAAGRALAERLGAGDVVALIGPLGAGKTQFVKGVCAGLGVARADRVNSPTFVLVNEYAGRLPVFHLDAYRLSGVGELGEIGFEEMLEAGGVVLVEWADRIAAAIPPAAITVRFEIVSPTQRRLTM